MNIQEIKVFSNVNDAHFFWLDSVPVIIWASLVCFPCFNSVSYDFHCLMLCKKTSNIIIIMNILTAIIQYISIHKMLYYFFSIWSSWCLCLCHVRKLSFRRILVILPLSAHALFEDGRFNKDGQKNKRENINKPERNTMLHSGGNL